jgi:hypothetical protein
VQTITADICPMYAVKPEDVKLFIHWMSEQRAQVDFDKETLSYPRSCMTHARKGEETVAMIPLQPVLMFESLVRKPELTKRQTALSLYRIGEEVERIAKDTGHREAYFITNDRDEAASCAKHGWTIELEDGRGKWLMKRKFPQCES